MLEADAAPFQRAASVFFPVADLLFTARPGPAGAKRRVQPACHEACEDKPGGILPFAAANPRQGLIFSACKAVPGRSANDGNRCVPGLDRPALVHLLSPGSKRRPTRTRRNSRLPLDARPERKPGLPRVR